MALIDITVKTLDGQNRSFSVPEQMTVRSFKEKISNSIEISADTQRLIFHGRVMQDDKELREYDIHGKAVHVVQRAPPSSTSNTDGGSTSQNPPHHHHHHHGPGTPDASMLDVQIHFGGMNTAATSRDARQRIQQAEINVGIINDALDLLEQRTGTESSQPSGEDRAGEGTQEDMETSTSTAQTEPTTTTTTTTTTSASATATSGTGAGGSSGQQQQTTTPPSSQSQSQSRSRDSSASRSQNQEGLSATDLADFLDRALVTSRRMEPHLIRYRDILNDNQTYTASSQEARNAQEVANRVMEAVHAMSHLMHSLSDVMVDMHTPAPRQAIATPVSPFAMPGTNTMAIPIHMNVRARPMDNNGRGRGRGGGGTATPTQTAQSRPNTASMTTTGTTTTATNNNTPTSGTTAAEDMDNSDPASQNTGPILVDRIQVGEPIVTVHNIQATVVADDDMLLGDDGIHDGMQFDASGVPGASISIVSTNQNAAAAATTASSTGSTSAPTTSSSNNATSNTTTSGSARMNMAGTPNAATAGFTMGPTTNVNIGGTGGLGALPNVPGLPGGMLQNIVQSILNNHGVQAGQPVQVNVVHPGGLAGGLHIHPQGSSQTRPSGTNTASPARTLNLQSGNNNNTRPAQLRPILINRGRPTPYPLGPRQAQPRPPGGVGSTTTTTTTSNNNGGGGSATQGAPHHHHHHHHHHNQQRGFVDPFLPCSSHHYLSQTARRAARTTRNQGQQQVPNLSTMVSGMVGDLIGQVGGHVHQHAAAAAAARGNNNGGSRTTTTSSSTTSSTNTSGGGNQPTAGNPGGGPPLPGMPAGFNPMQMLAGLIGGGPGGPGGPQSGPGGPPGGPIHLDLTSLLANMMGANVNTPAGQRNASGNPGSNTTTTTTTTSGSTGSSNAPMSTAQPSSTPGGMGGGPMGGTLADLFRQFTSQTGSSDGSDLSEASFVQALIETVAPHIRLTDLFSLVMGNTRVIGQVRQPLRQFAQERVTQLGSVDNVVSAALDDMNSEIVFVTGCVEVRPGIDMAQSLRACVRHHLHKIIEAIRSESPASQEAYGQELFNLWMSALSQVIALCIYCINNGETGFAHMLQQYMPRLTRDLTPGIGVWMSTSVQDILSSFHHNHPVPQADILAFVVNTPPRSESQPVGATDGEPTPTPTPDHSANAAATTSSITATTAPEIAATPLRKTSSSPIPTSTGSAASATSPVVPMEVTDSPSVQPPRPKVPRTHQQTKDGSNDSGDEFVDAPEEFTSRPPAGGRSVSGVGPMAIRPNQIATSPSSSASRMGQDAMRNGEACGQWQDVVPQEWIPVIRQDVERQKEQRSQPPLSDAYLQGLPAKRRRMMVLEHSGEMGNMPHYLPSAIARAARAAGVEPISSQDNLMQEAGDERELQQSLEQEVQAVVESRISSDQDFNSDRFPNSLRYFQRPRKNP